MASRILFLFAALVNILYFTNGVVHDFESIGAIADALDNVTVFHNRDLLMNTIQSLQAGDRLVISNKTFHLVGGVYVNDVADVVIQIDGASINYYFHCIYAQPTDTELYWLLYY